jgi:hypothetical protein
MDNKNIYKEFCKKEQNLPIYSKSWWLDAVCGKDNWDVAIVEKGGQIWATMPYFLKKEFIFNVITMPPITQTMGPYIKYPANVKKISTKVAWDKKMMNQLIKQLPYFDVFNQNFYYDITNWLPFYWQGFNQYTRYTYIIEEKSIEDAQRNFENDIRRRIKKANSLNISVVKSDNVDILYKLTKQTFDSKKEKTPYSYEFLKNLYEVVKENNSGHIYVAKDENENILYANLLIYDNNYVYYILGGTNPKVKDIGAIDKVLYESIKFAIENNKKFNFVGSMIESIEKYFRSYGAKQVPYFNVYKSNSKFWKVYQFILSKVVKK